MSQSEDRTITIRTPELMINRTFHTVCLAHRLLHQCRKYHLFIIRILDLSTYVPFRYRPLPRLRPSRTCLLSHCLFSRALSGSTHCGRPVHPCRLVHLLLFLRHLFCLLLLLLHRQALPRLSPCPSRSETVKEAHVLEQVRIDPNPRLRPQRYCQQKYGEPHDRQSEERSHEPQTPHGQIPYPDARPVWPEREQHDRHDAEQGADGVELRAPLAALVEPDVVQLVRGVLLGLDLDVPDRRALHALRPGRFLLWLVGVDARHADGEHGQREELEGVLGGRAVGDGGEKRVFRARRGVRGGL